MLDGFTAKTFEVSVYYIGVVLSCHNSRFLLLLLMYKTYKNSESILLVEHFRSSSRLLVDLLVDCTREVCTSKLAGPVVLIHLTAGM